MKRPTNNGKGRIGIVAEALNIFKDEIVNLELTDVSMSTMQFYKTKTFIINLLKRNFKRNLKLRIENYDNIKRYNNIVLTASRLLGIDLKEYKIKHTENFYKRRNDYFNRFEIYVSNKQLHKLLKIK